MLVCCEGVDVGCVLSFQFNYILFLLRILNFSPSLTILKPFCFELLIILKLLSSTKGAALPENKRNIFKSFLISYFIIKQTEVELNSKLYRQ